MGKKGKRKGKTKVILGTLLILFVTLFLILYGLQFVLKKEQKLQNAVTNSFSTIKNVDTKKCHENEDYLVNGENATIYLIFNRIDDYLLNYTIQKNDSNIYITSKKHLTGIIGIPERKHILYEDCIEINLTLPIGEYRIFVDGAQLNKTLQIGPTEEELTYCEKDDDCVVFNSACCPGYQNEKRAINKSYIEYFSQERINRCKGIICFGIGDNRPINPYIKAVCVMNQCYIKGEEPKYTYG